MIRKSYIRILKKSLRRSSTKRNAFLVGALAVLTIVSLSIMSQRNSITPAAYTPLLEVIASAESKGNYNAYFGNAANKEINFTAMSIADIFDWQKKYISEGSPSSAVGRYQIIQPTLEGLVKDLKLTTNERFDKNMQNRMAIALMERRGSVDFINKKLSAEDFAHQLSKEWAALPKVIGDSPDSSYYAGDGLNRSLVDSKTSLSAVQEFKNLADKV